MSTRPHHIAVLACALGLLAGCAAKPPDLRASDRAIELERFMGDWYVVSFIPIDIPFFSEADAHDAVENYRLNAQGGIDVTYRFRDGSFEAEPTVMRQKAWVYDERGTEWRVQLLWPFKSAYLIAWLDENYTRAVIGVPSRRYVWLLSRDLAIPPNELAALHERIAALGYDLELLRCVPHTGGAPCLSPPR